MSSYDRVVSVEAHETGTVLDVTDIIPVSYGTSPNTTYARLMLSREFAPLDDFRAEFAISWASDGDPTQATLLLYLHAAKGEFLGHVGYADSALDNGGQGVGNAGHQYVALGAGTSPGTGSALGTITRTNGLMEVAWNGTPVVSNVVTTPLGRVQMLLQFPAREKPGVRAVFSGFAVDRVSVEGEVVGPPPVTCSTLLAEANAMIGLLSAELADANTALTNANQTIAGLQSDLAAASATITQLQTQNAALQNTIDRQAEQNQQLWGLIMWLAGIIWGWP